MKFYEGKIVWIIGGTSGIGLAVARTLSCIKDCSIIISGRDVSKVEDIQNITKIALDVCNHEDFKETYKTVFEKFSRVDIILFCAGIYFPMSFKNYDHRKSLNTINTNLVSMVNFLDAIFKNIASKKPKIIGIISSVAGYFGMPNSLFYGASKAGLSHLAESLYIELKHYKVDVKLINPGFVETPLTNKNSFRMPFIISSEKASEIILKNLPKRRFEIAFPFIFIIILKFFGKMPFKMRSNIFITKSSL